MTRQDLIKQLELVVYEFAGDAYLWSLRHNIKLLDINAGHYFDDGDLIPVCEVTDELEEEICKSFGVNQDEFDGPTMDQIVAYTRIRPELWDPPLS